MILLSVRDVRKHFGPEPVLTRITFDVRSGQRIALVGPNGTGKTTLLRILAGHEEADAGQIEWHPTARVGFLEQEPSFPDGTTVWDQAREALRDLIDMAEQAEQVAQAMGATDDPSQRQRLGEQFDRLQHQLHQRDGYHLEHRIERVLEGLGFARREMLQPVDQLSGGQLNRLMLAQLLLAAPELMLLDEPSNHLDLAATEWLESFLTASGQALIVVSHDRYFLDKVTDHTFELFRGTVDPYAGNFSAYWRQKAERLEVQRRTFERQQTEITKLEDFIARNRYGQKHAQAEDRKQKLARIEPVDPPREIAAPAMAFPEAARCGDIVLRVEGLAKQYDRPLFEGLTFQVERGQRWGILGANGTGKTTLLRCILQQEQPDAGNVVLGAGVRVGYFDQQLAGLADDAQVVDAVRPSHKEFDHGQRRSLLARFGLSGDIVLQRVAQLSGGERNRTALAQLAASDANLLILDEPTNHLDLWARDALWQALKRFNGTVIFVSHDRYLLNHLADHLLVVEPGRFRVLEGDLDLYSHLVAQGLASGEAASRGEASSPQEKVADTKSQRDRQPRRKRRFPYRKAEDLEAEIFDRETAIERLHEQLTDPDVLRDGPRVKQVQTDIEQHRAALATLYEHWEEAVEMN